MAKKINLKSKEETVNLKENGLSNVAIAKKLLISERSVQRILKEKNCKIENLAQGRPKKLFKREENLVIRQFDRGVLENTTNGVEFVKDRLEKNISNSTVRRLVKKRIK